MCHFFVEKTIIVTPVTNDCHLHTVHGHGIILTFVLYLRPIMHGAMDH